MSSNASGAECALPECHKPCFKDRRGFVHDYCGRSHAEEMRLRRHGAGAGRQLGACQMNGSGKAPGLYNPRNSEDTFSIGTTIARTCSGARTGGSAPSTPYARNRAAHSSSEYTGKTSGGVGLKRPTEMSGGVRDVRGGGGRSSGRVGGHPYSMTGVDPWGPVHLSPGAGSGYRAGGNGDGRVDASLVRTTDDFVLFWQEPACFVQWTACTFEVQGVRFCTAEQFMMACKAVEFGDSETYRQIMATADPKKQKDLGRGVKGFIPAVWDDLAYDVVVEGNLAKFRQNPRFRDELLATGDRILAEASPYDKEWGIGLRVDDPDALVQARWRGKNKLGGALMEVRFILQSEAYGAEQDENEKKVKEVKAGKEKGKAGGKEEKEGEKGREKEKEENEKKTMTAKKKHSCAACLASASRVVDEGGVSGAEGDSSGRVRDGRAGK